MSFEISEGYNYIFAKKKKYERYSFCRVDISHDGKFFLFYAPGTYHTFH